MLLFLCKVLVLSAVIMLVIAGLFVAYSLHDYEAYKADMIKKRDDERFGIVPFHE